MAEELITRFKEVILLGSGVKIYPEAIEEIYTKIAPVKAMCVFTVAGMQGVKKSKVLWAIIQPDLNVFRQFGEVNLRAVLKERFDNAAQAMPMYQRIKGFTITLEDLPCTLLGFIDRRAIKALYEPRVLAGIEGALPVDETPSAEDLGLMHSLEGVKILACLKEESGIQRHLILEDSLELDLGIDSLGRIELASCLETSFNREISEEAISRAFSVRDLIVGMTEALKGADVVSFEDQGPSIGPNYWKEHLEISPKKETLEMLELSTGYFAWLFRLLLTAVDCLLFKVFFNFKAEGADNVPKEGAYIIFGNHTSFLDGPAIAAGLPRRPVFQLFYFVFGPYFFRPFEEVRVLRNFVKMGRFIPFDFSTHFLEALRSCYFVLQNGKGLCFFPEGLRGSTGKIGEFKKGFGVLAKVTGAKLIPVAIDGAHEAWPSTAKYPRRYSIKVRFGKPLLPEDLEKQGFAMGATNSYEAICMAARKALVELKGNSK